MKVACPVLKRRRGERSPRRPKPRYGIIRPNSQDAAHSFSTEYALRVQGSAKELSAASGQDKGILTSSHPLKEMGFPLRGEIPASRERAFPGPLWSYRPPQANTASPAALIFKAAFTSRSWTYRIRDRSIPEYPERESRRCPQPEQRLELGYHWSIATTERPYQAALYSSWLTSRPSPHQQSLWPGSDSAACFSQSTTRHRPLGFRG